MEEENTRKLFAVGLEFSPWREAFTSIRELFFSHDSGLLVIDGACRSGEESKEEEEILPRRMMTCFALVLRFLS
jgi:hypothetical protein